MSKYSKELKLEIVKYCIEESHSKYEAADKFHIPSPSLVDLWVRKYKEHGLDGLLKNKSNYDGKFKQYVVEYMHNNHLSLFETCIKFNIGNHCIVGKWERIYYEKGPQALYEEKRGKSMNMKSKPKKQNLDKEQDLVEEVKRLRMKNEYLKKLNALVQERIKHENKKK